MGLRRLRVLRGLRGLRGLRESYAAAPLVVQRNSVCSHRCITIKAACVKALNQMFWFGVKDHGFESLGFG